MTHVHFIGIGGSGLSAIARLLLESGYMVSGSDRALTPFAEELRKAGATVYVTGRTVKEKMDVEKLGGTVFQTATDVTEMGGKGIAIPCDHTDDEQVEKVFKQIAKQSKKIDILVNNAWGGYEMMREGRVLTYFKPFWEQPFWRWDAMFHAGVRAAYVASAFAARMMVEQQSGLIVNISFWAAQKYMANVAYGAAKAAVESARLNVEWCRVVAPISGRISYKHVTTGNLVTGGIGSGTLLTTIVSVDPMYAYFDVDERTVQRIQRLIREGKLESNEKTDIPVWLGLAAEDGFPHLGTINFVDNQVNSRTGTLRVRGVFPNAAGALSPGYFARVKVPVSAPHKAVLVAERLDVPVFATGMSTVIPDDDGPPPFFGLRPARTVVGRAVPVQGGGNDVGLSPRPGQLARQSRHDPQPAGIPLRQQPGHTRHRRRLPRAPPGPRCRPRPPPRRRPARTAT